jgi:hypothetical protein
MISLNKYLEYNEKTYVIDGANVCWIRKDKNNMPTLTKPKHLPQKLHQLEVGKEKIISIFDVNLKYQIAMRNDFEALLYHNDNFKQALGRVRADDIILGYYLRNQNALIISNDMVRGYYNQIPSQKWLMKRRIAVSVILGEIILNPYKN